MNHSKSKLEKTAFWVNIVAFILATLLPVIFALFIGKISFALIGLIGLLALVNIKLMKSHSKWAREFLLGAPLLVATLAAIIMSNDSGLRSFLEILILSYLLFFLPGLLAYLVYRKNEVPQMAFYKSPVLVLVSILFASTVGKTYVDKQYQAYLANQPPVFQKTDSNNDFERWIAFQGGFYDQKLKDYIIPPQFEEVDAFSEGLAAVKIKGKWGYINSDGELVIKPKFTKAGPFKNDRAIAVVGSVGAVFDTFVSTEETLLIDIDGEVVKKNKFITFGCLGCDLIPVRKELGGIDRKSGTFIDAPLGYMDRNLNLVIDFKFSSAGDFASNGIAHVTSFNEDKSFYIDKKGKAVRNIEFSQQNKIENKDKKAARKNGFSDYEKGMKVYKSREGKRIIYEEKVCDQNVIKNANGKVIWPKGFDESCNNQPASNSLKYVPSDSSKTVDSAPKYSKSRNEKSPFEIALQKINNQAPRQPLLIDSSTKRDYVSKEGIVIDRDNNLMWSRCAHGQSWNGKTCSGEALEVTWEQAVDIAKSSTLGNFHDWRLPTIKELQTLIYCSNGKRIQYEGVRDLEDEGSGCIIRNSRALEDTPTIDISQFINHLGYGYWSSTTLPANAYSVLFDESKKIFMRGTTYLAGRKYADNVRLVRSGHG